MFQHIRGLFMARLTGRRNVMALAAVLLFGLLLLVPSHVAVADPPVQHIFGTCVANGSGGSDTNSVDIDGAFYTDLPSWTYARVEYYIEIDGVIQPPGINTLWPLSQNALTPTGLSVDFTSNHLDPGYHHLVVSVIGWWDGADDGQVFVYDDQYIYIPN
jgi:hypothetical protein